MFVSISFLSLLPQLLNNCESEKIQMPIPSCMCVLAPMCGHAVSGSRQDRASLELLEA